MPFVFKASFDKANRSSVNSYRGPGIKEGLRILKGVRDRGIAVLTDIHEPAQAALAAEAVDILQIPAFLCRQTDLLVEAGTDRASRSTSRRANSFRPHDIRLAAEKVASTGNDRILLTERGSSFGYNNLVVDMRGLAIMRGFGWPVVFDATHSVQLPGAAGTASGGQPEFIEPLAQRRRGRGRRRRVRRSARSAGARVVGWRECAAARSARTAVAEAPKAGSRRPAVGLDHFLNFYKVLSLWRSSVCLCKMWRGLQSAGPASAGLYKSPKPAG